MRTRLFSLLFVAYLVAACTKIYPTAPTAPDPVPAPTPTPDVIEFRVFGSNLLTPVTIRHIDPVNGLTIVTSSPPYFATVQTTAPEAFVYLEASGTGFSTAVLQVQIFANGKVFREGSSVGPVLFASASGTVHR